MVVEKPTADVISLHGRPRRIPESQRIEKPSRGARRHPARLSDEDGRTADSATVIQSVDPRLPGAGFPADAAFEHQPLARRIAGVAESVRRRVTGDYQVDEFGF